MALNTRISLDAAIDMVDAFTARLLTGGSGYIEIRTGVPPAALEDSATGTLLATCDLNAVPFAPAEDANPGAMAIANAIDDDPSADADGAAGYFRAYSGDATPQIQGSVGTTDADMIVNTTTVAMGLPFGIQSWIVKLPEAPGEAPGNG